MKVHAYELLEQAANTLKERGKDRDNGNERSMAKTVEVFNLLEGENLSEVQGWRFMQILKMVRQKGSGDKCFDSFVDDIGYAALKAEAAIKQIKKSQKHG